MIARTVHRHADLARTFARFIAVGGLSAAVNIALTVTLHEVVGLSTGMSFACALVLVFVMNFFLARSYIYQAGGPRSSQFARFLAWTAAFRLGEYMLFLLLNPIMGIYYIASILIVLVASNLTKFVVYRRWVFFTPAAAIAETEHGQS
jgi:putative flippase GtrA